MMNKHRRQGIVSGQIEVRPAPELPDALRPEWRSFMQLWLRWAIAPFASGRLPAPVAEPFVEAIISKYAEAVPLAQDLALYARASSIKRGPRRREAWRLGMHRLLRDAHALFAGSGIDMTWSREALELEDDVHELLGWWLGVNVVALARWGIPLPVLIRVARDAPATIATAALNKLVIVEKTAIYFPWVRERFERAHAEGDMRYIAGIGRALATPTVPLALRKGALDMFLAAFDPLLREMPLKQQVEFLREAGLKTSTNALRNRRSRLRFAAVDREAITEVSPELAAAIRASQAIIPRPPGQ